MSQELTFTAEQLLAEANKHGDHVADMLTYAATLCQAARVDEVKLPDPETMCAMWIKPRTSADEYAAFLQGARKMRAALEAALSAQPAERQGEAVAEIGPYWELRYVGNEPISKIVDRSGLKIGDKLYLRPAAPVGVPDGVLLLDFAVNHAEKAVGNRGVVFELRFDPLPFRDGNLRDYLLAAAPSAPQGEG